MSVHGVPAALPARWQLVLKYFRRSCGQMLRCGVRKVVQSDDWANFSALLLSRGSSYADCSICAYAWPFLQHADQPREICPLCGSRARHRVFRLALEQWRRKWDITHADVLHVAPEWSLRRTLVGVARRYVTADLRGDGCDLALDLCELPFSCGSFDLVFTSHVLEHIVDDRRALREIRRVLRRGGVAVLPVPITVDRTVEWGRPDPVRNGHTRECGLEYFDRYRECGFHVRLYSTDDFDEPELKALASWRHGVRTVHWILFCLRT